MSSEEGIVIIFYNANLDNGRFFEAGFAFKYYF